MLIGRQRMTQQIELLIVLLGQRGFSAKCISEIVFKQTGEPFCHATIYKALKGHDVSLRSYRNGETIISRKIIKDTIKPLMSEKPKSRKKKKEDRVAVLV